MSQAVKRFGKLDYERCREILPAQSKKDRKVIGPNTILFRDGINYYITYHSTDIVSYYPDGSVHLDSGGYRSVTTKQRMNALVLGINVHQKKGKWFVTFARTGETVPFEDGMNVGARTLEEVLVYSARNGDLAAKAALHDLREESRIS